MHFKPFFASLFILASIGNGSLQAQQDPTVSAIIKEANENSQLKRMSHEPVSYTHLTLPTILRV